MSILIAESGGTRTHWVFIEANGSSDMLGTIGLNPNLAGEALRCKVLEDEVKPWLAGRSPRDFRFFGAGLADEGHRCAVKRDLCRVLEPGVDPEVSTDMMAAAYACLGHQAGVVGLLGTGSVAFHFDGEQITARKGGLGYLLGDEGSGVALGRAFLRQLLNDSLPERIERLHLAFSGMDKDETRRQFLHHARPALFLAEQAPFLANYMNEPEIAALLEREFGAFIRQDLLPLTRAGDEHVVLSGGIARHFAALLKPLFRRFGLDNLTILEEPPINRLALHLWRAHAT